MSFCVSRILLEAHFFFFNDTATTEIYTLSLHDALPISATSPCRSRTAPARSSSPTGAAGTRRRRPTTAPSPRSTRRTRSEEHTSELQSRQYLVCRLLLEKKKKDSEEYAAPTDIRHEYTA